MDHRPNSEWICQNKDVDETLITALAELTEIDTSERRRAEYASDASNYRVPPLAVIFPRNSKETEQVLTVLREANVPVTSRGGGTSVAGNSIGPGVVLDFSRHMNRILEIDPESRTARVQPGVIMSDLQDAAAPFGLWFGPDPSTKNRATLGGMIGNNACGPHALTFGRTSDNVISLDVVDGLGRRFTAGAGEGTLEQVPGLPELVSDNLAVIRTELGRFVRQVSGYSLEHLLPENGRDLAKALVGSEGTCVTVLEATLELKPVPTKPILLVLGYPNMVEAANAVEGLLTLNPLALEGMDSRLVEVVRKHRGSVPELPEGQGWLFCEVAGDEDVSAEQKAEELAAASGALEYRVVADPAVAADLWRIRADGVGLAGRTPAGNQAWPGWEDAAVPPAVLGPYLADFQDLMDGYGIEGLTYGHFGDGCIHVRMDVPLEEQGDVPTFKSFMEDAAKLVGKYGGSLSGEHGDGRARGALLPHMYPDPVIELFEKFKALFDPDNILNPGVLVQPAPITEALRRPEAKYIQAEGFAFISDNGDFTSAVHRCVGVGKCRADNFTVGGFMCPSYQATKDEKDVTRGRSRILQDLTRGAFKGDWSSPIVEESLDLCLSCKACGTDCPAGVDMSKYKSEVLFRKYKGRLRPLNHYILGWLPTWSRLITALPAVAWATNALMSVAPLRKTIFSLGGLAPQREMTSFATQRFSRWLKKQPAPTQNRPNASTSGDSSGRDVLLWVDEFSEYMDPTMAQSMIEVLQDAGYQVRVPSLQVSSGLTWISTGQLDGAKRELHRALDVLGPAALAGVPIVGVEPSAIAVMRDDLQDLLPGDPRTEAIGKMTMTLAELLTDPKFGPGEDWFNNYSLAGTKVVAQPHCHQYAVMGYQADMNVLAKLGAEVTELAGCCGLAGNFGMEKGHYDISVKVAENQLLPTLRNADDDTVFLADGYSCRTQAKQLNDTTGIGLPTLLQAAKQAQ